jgi:hypothetical protein
MPNSASSKERPVPDPYRITEASVAPQAPRGQGGIVRPLLWLLLVISATCNAVTSSMDISVFVGIAFGLLTLLCGAALVVDHYRRRRR